MTILLFLTGCVPYMAHHPDLASEPTDKEQYSKDLDDCRREVFAKRGMDIGQSATYAGFGLVGMAAYGEPPAYHDVDECVSAKGYKVITSQNNKPAQNQP